MNAWFVPPREAPWAIVVFLASSFFVIAVFAQDKPNDKMPQPITRLSYSQDFAAQKLLTVCVAVYGDGTYQMFRKTINKIERVQGILPNEELSKLEAMLKEMDAADGGIPGIVTQGSESFGAEILTNHNVEQYRWLDPDHRQPFPQSIVNVVTWLRNFMPKDATPIFGNEPICPVSERPLRPAIAEVY
ncbi:MAG TPA: hypothetical protein VKW78_06460 [Terriglobales bacterium]|nr:hypothetical protein [Terriglobales bacterium]